MWVQTQPNSQSSFQKLDFDNSCQKTRKIRYYIFEVLPNFTVYLYFVPNILSRIVDNLLAASICNGKFSCLLLSYIIYTYIYIYIYITSGYYSYSQLGQVSSLCVLLLLLLLLFQRSYIFKLLFKYFSLEWLCKTESMI